MRKEGYEFPFRLNPKRGFEYSGQVQRFVPDKDHPVVFHLRKKRPAIFVMEEKYLDFQVLPDRSGKAITYDFVQGEYTREGEKPTHPMPPLVSDLSVTATLNPGDGSWTVNLLPGTTNGGIIVSDQFLAEAPGKCT